MSTNADALTQLAEDARAIQGRASAAARNRPGHPAPLAVADQAAALALSAEWFARETPGTMHHALPLVRARLRALNTELEPL